MHQYRNYPRQKSVLYICCICNYMRNKFSNKTICSALIFNSQETKYQQLYWSRWNVQCLLSHHCHRQLHHHLYHHLLYHHRHLYHYCHLSFPSFPLPHHSSPHLPPPSFTSSPSSTSATSTPPPLLHHHHHLHHHLCLTPLVSHSWGWMWYKLPSMFSILCRILRCLASSCLNSSTTYLLQFFFGLYLLAFYIQLHHIPKCAIILIPTFYMTKLSQPCFP